MAVHFIVPGENMNCLRVWLPGMLSVTSLAIFNSYGIDISFDIFSAQTIPDAYNYPSKIMMGFFLFLTVSSRLWYYK